MGDLMRGLFDRDRRGGADGYQWINYDPLTQLPNRHMFHICLKHEILNTQRSNLTLAYQF